MVLIMTFRADITRRRRHSRQIVVDMVHCDDRMAKRFTSKRFAACFIALAIDILFRLYRPVVMKLIYYMAVVIMDSHRQIIVYQQRPAVKHRMYANRHHHRQR
jgi:hypothetical protein